ncbi:MAG: GNAT family N-acetyltransferase [Clostridium sp.]|uniref:GNAT family N-acetyltransferase n=1 Tax=Clostridium sp. TaxID=1506 RepID=UPI001D94642A|nr:GNAT family N-acetyltransferase [Clostridium sp.]MBS5938764.1 GNAT family N-acetyltransferase [Clostridium sp.]MBS5950267.1 GNAT family N-acetyltransferase [Clostridium sp.]
MDNYIIDTVDQNDISKIIDIYNSNKTFLENHVGISKVSKDFIVNEIEEMNNIGFSSLVIKNNEGNIVGICDFKIGDEVYLSLLMIDANLKGNGLGRIIYNQLEKIFKTKNSKRIRIDVVYDYEENALGFWEKQGFVPSEEIQLEWNGYKSKAIKMYKNI